MAKKNARKASRENGGATAVVTEVQNGTAVAPAVEEKPLPPPLFLVEKGKTKPKKDHSPLFGEPDGNDEHIAVTVVKGQLFVWGCAGGRMAQRSVEAIAKETGANPTQVVLYKRYRVGEAIPEPVEEAAEETAEE